MMFDPESSTFRFLPAAVGVPGSLCCSSICTAAAMDIGHTPRILEPASSSLQPCDAPLGASRAGRRGSCTPATAPPRQPPRLPQARHGSPPRSSYRGSRAPCSGASAWAARLRRCGTSQASRPPRMGRLRPVVLCAGHLPGVAGEGGIEVEERGAAGSERDRGRGELV